MKYIVNRYYNHNILRCHVVNTEIYETTNENYRNDEQDEKPCKLCFRMYAFMLDPLLTGTALWGKDDFTSARKHYEINWGGMNHLLSYCF